jgi:DNA-binding phage protein
LTQASTLPRNALREREDPVPEGELSGAASEAVADCRSMLLQVIEEAGVTQAILAERLNKTRSNIAQVLTRGEGNPTIRTVAAWLYALGFRLVLDFEPLDADPGKDGE